MPLTKEKKKDIVTKFKISEHDTGSSPVQVALLTDRIQYLTEHLKVQKKDFASRRGLFKLVGQRKSLLNYIKKNDVEEYQKLIERLNLRK